MRSVLDIAGSLAARGWHLFPVRAGGKAPVRGFSWTQDATTDPAKVQDWLAQDLNYGVNCGASGLLVVDEDLPGDLARWQADHGVTLPATFTVRTPSGGAHYYYRQGTLGIGNSGAFKKHGYGIDVRGHGGYVVGPGSVSAQGILYEIEADRPVALLPDALKEFLTAKDKEPTRGPVLAASPGPVSDLDRLFLSGGDRPGDLFDADHDTPEKLAEYLCRFGWQVHHQSGGTIHLTRPGKTTGEGTSATVRIAHGRPGFYVFSTSTPFTTETPYTPFGCYTVLEHGGDHSAAARALKAGYNGNHAATPTRPGGDAVTDSKGVTTSAERATRNFELVDLRSFDMEVARFAKRDWYPLGDISIVSGAGGIGKSSITLADVAAATRGDLDGDLTGPQNVILMCHEDRGGTIRARLTAARADLDYVHLVRITETTPAGTLERVPDLTTDLEALEDAITTTRATLVVIDPIQSYVEGNDHRRADVRKVLDPLMLMAQKTGVALVGVAHTNKGGGKSTDKISGSHAWRDSCRSHLFAAGDTSTGERSITLDKSNHTDKAGTSWAFETVGVDVVMSDGLMSSIPVARIIGETELSAEAIINRAPNQEEPGDLPADEWLERIINEAGGEIKASAVFRTAREDGYSESTVKRARKKLGIVSTRKGQGVGGGSMWSLPIQVTEGFNQVTPEGDPNEKGPESRGKVSSTASFRSPMDYDPNEPKAVEGTAA